MSAPKQVSPEKAEAAYRTEYNNWLRRTNWNPTPFRNAPDPIKGLKPVTREPWYASTNERANHSHLSHLSHTHHPPPTHSTSLHYLPVLTRRYEDMAIYNAKFSDNKLEPTEAYDDGTFGTTKKLPMTEDEVRAAGPLASAGLAGTCTHLGWLAHAVASHTP